MYAITQDEALLISPNPFVMQDRGIGYAIDGKLSYNTEVSKYIYAYMQEMKQANRLSEVSVEGLQTFMQNRYKTLFEEGNIVRMYESGEEKAVGVPFRWMENKREVAELFLTSLNPEATMEQFYEHLEDIENEDYIGQMEEYFYDLLYRHTTSEMPQRPSKLRKDALEIAQLVKQKEELQQKRKELQNSKEQQASQEEK